MYPDAFDVVGFVVSKNRVSSQTLIQVYEFCGSEMILYLHPKTTYSPSDLISECGDGGTLEFSGFGFNSAS